MKLRPKARLRISPATKIEIWPIGSLKPFQTNSRAHTKSDVLAVKASIERWGMTVPLLVDEHGTVISGHCRLSALKLLERQKVPVVVARGWSESEKRAYCIADNQLAARATWDVEVLRGELKFLERAKFDLPLIGFDEAGLLALMGQLAEQVVQGDPNAEIEPPTDPVSRLGDVWKLGRHTVVCGDSTDRAAVDLTLGKSQRKSNIVLMVADPPYGVSYDPAWRGLADKRKAGRSIGKVLNDDRADWRAAWELFPGVVAYVWHAGLFGGVVADSLTACGFEIRSQIIWAKTHFTLSRGDYHWQHECCLYAVRKGAKRHWRSDRKQSTLWEVPSNGAVGNPNREKIWGHGTQKPVELMRRPIEHNSARGDVVYDPFLGTGTTLIAAEMTGRICAGLELNPAYVDVIVRRWMEFTGHEAIQAATGKTFNELAKVRTRPIENSRVS